MNIQTRLQEKREELGPKLPLEQPYVLLVDPSNICNLRCVWCPSGHDDLIAGTHRKQTIMDYNMFCSLVDSVGEFGLPIQVLRMYKEGEPLVNPKFVDMVDYAKRSGNFLRIDTTTNGLLFCPDLNRALIEAGIDQINISVNGISEEQIYRNTGRRIDFKQYVKNIRDLYLNRGGMHNLYKVYQGCFVRGRTACFSGNLWRNL